MKKNVDTQQILFHQTLVVDFGVSFSWEKLIISTV